MAKDDRAVQLLKGVIELAILALLEDQPRYGGELVDELGARPGLEASSGTVYPLLTRLRTSGLVETAWRESPVGPPRKYYTLTPSGHEAMTTLTVSWRELNVALTGLLEGAER
jgi:PadR family transcriptional regulator PadR